MLRETSSRLNTMKNDSLYHRLLNDIKDDLTTSATSLLTEAEGLCILSNTSDTYLHSTNTSSHNNAINDSKNQVNFIENLTANWRSHAAIGLGVQTFGSFNTRKSISKHLGHAISLLTNQLNKSQDLIAHFLIFNSSSNHLGKHIKTTLDYIKTLTKGGTSTQLSSIISP